jgi:fatty acid desaturase
MTEVPALEPATVAAGAALRRRIRDELPADVFAPRPRRVVTALALAAAIAATSAGLAILRLPVWAGLPLSVVVGGLYGSLFFLGHEAGHGAVVRSRVGQDLLMGGAFLIFLLPPTLWRVWHNAVHHVHTNRPDYDPDNFGIRATYDQFPSVRAVEALTPGSGRWLSVLYFAVWFTVHSQVVLWVLSRRCRGFEALARGRTVAETAGMAAFWLSLGVLVGPWTATLVILIPMIVANAIIMSYIATNHLLRPLTDHPDPLDHSMSVTTARWLDRIHFHFSHHVEHHLFPSMSSRFAPLVRAKILRYAPDRYLAPPHGRALRWVVRTPRIHEGRDMLVDPRRGRRMRCRDVDGVLRDAGLIAASREVTT